jgi:hypothetical protein
MYVEGAATQPEQLPDGSRWLEIIRLGHLRGQQIPVNTRKGQTVILADTFFELCGPEACDYMRDLESSDPADPDYELGIADARDLAARYIADPALLVAPGKTD